MTGPVTPAPSPVKPDAAPVKPADAAPVKPADASARSPDGTTGVDALVVPDAGTPAPLDAGGDGVNAATCSPPTAFVCNTKQKNLPISIKDLGLYPTAGNFEVVAAGVHTFVPRHELWSDGLHKKRHVVVPPGDKIDISNRNEWVFPIGTAFFKTFLGDGPNGIKPIETRVVRRTDNPDPFEQYRYDVYRWNEAGTDATLLNIDEPTPAPVTVAGKSFTHQIPSRDDCLLCHGANDTSIIGFDEVRLNHAPMPGAKTFLQTFADAGLFNQAPPSPAAEITDANAMAKQVKAYVYGNCFHCHNGKQSNVFDLGLGTLPDTFLAKVVGQPTQGSGTAGGTRVSPGKPDLSILYRQMTRMNLPKGLNPMPPVGVQIADPEALQLVRAWIMSMPAQPAR